MVNALVTAMISFVKLESPDEKALAKLNAPTTSSIVPGITNDKNEIAAMTEKPKKLKGNKSVMPTVNANSPTKISTALRILEVFISVFSASTKKTCADFIWLTYFFLLIYFYVL